MRAADPVLRYGALEFRAATQALCLHGRPLTLPQVEKALRGETISGPAKTRVLRAVNEILKARKKAEIGLRDLF